MKSLTSWIMLLFGVGMETGNKQTTKYKVCQMGTNALDKIK